MAQEIMQVIAVSLLLLVGKRKGIKELSERPLLCALFAQEVAELSKRLCVELVANSTQMIGRRCWRARPLARLAALPWHSSPLVFVYGWKLWLNFRLAPSLGVSAL